MAEELDPQELVSFEELLISEVTQSEALINLLDRKGIISKRDLLEEMKKVQKVQASLPIALALIGIILSVITRIFIVV